MNKGINRFARGATDEIVGTLVGIVKGGKQLFSAIPRYSCHPIDSILSLSTYLTVDVSLLYIDRIRKFYTTTPSQATLV